MKAINGVKVFEVGSSDGDCFFAPTKEEAIAKANKTFGDGFVGPEGDIPLEEVTELTDERFEKGMIIDFDEDGNPMEDDEGKYIKITNLQHLNSLTEGGSKVGHFSSMEW